MYLLFNIHDVKGVINARALASADILEPGLTAPSCYV